MSNHHARDPQAAGIALAAARLTGTAEEFGARLRALLDEGPPQARRGETSAQAADRIDAARRHEVEVAALRQRLAADFAESRGLQVATTPMSRKELARRAALGSKWHRSASEWPSPLRHPTFYRGTATRRAAAMVAHVSPEEMDLAAVEAWAAEFDLAASFPGFPSWQDPVRSVLVVLEPAEPASTTAVRIEPDLLTLTAPPTAPDLDAMRPEVPDEIDEPDRVDEAVMSQISAPVEAASDPAEMTDAAPPAASVMRPIAPLDLDGVTPRDLTDEEDPDWAVVDPAELLIDEAYQRGLSPKSIALIRRIVANWSWARFKTPTCVSVDGRLHVLDGQHTAIAAASHPGIGAIPVLIAKLPEVADHAAAFISHNRDRVQATAVQLHRAALTAGDEEAVALDAVCRAAGVEMLPFPPSGGAPYAPGQTVAVVGIRRLIERRGAERAAEILSALAAADLAPISGDHLRIAETLLCDPAYADAFDPERLTAALRDLPARTHVEARELAIAQRLAPWRALAAVLYRNATKPKPRGRGGAEPAQGRRRAGA